MSDVQTAVNDILNDFDDSAYPSEFLEKYDQLECLAASHGTETFLVKRKSEEQLFVAKCYDKKSYSFVHEGNILKSLHHIGLPTFTDEFQNNATVCIVREYVDGQPLNQYIAENNPTRKDIINIGVQLCEILAYLHGQERPVIHRDIKPQNVIVKDDGQIVLIDFGISRVYNSEAEADTQFLGTREYAPPEQYGFSQTDCRTDIYSFGILLRFMLTGSVKENPNIHAYKPLERIIRKCAAFAPKERFKHAASVKKALLAANPESQRRRKLLLAAMIALCVFGGVKGYQYATSDPFAAGMVPIVLTDEVRVADAVSFMKDKYSTDLFNDTSAYADIGFIKTILTDIYGYGSDFIHAMPEKGVPHQREKNIFPREMGEVQDVDCDVMVCIAVKIYRKDHVSNYSNLEDDNSDSPGVRVAVAFAGEKGIHTGVRSPKNITKGEAAILLANIDRIFEVTKE